MSRDDRRVLVYMPQQAEEIRQEAGITKKSFVLQAAELLIWVLGEIKTGRSVVSMRNGKIVKEVSLPWAHLYRKNK